MVLPCVTPPVPSWLASQGGYGARHAGVSSRDRRYRDQYRAVFCRALARLRREQQRWEEALALGERAAELLDDFGEPLEATQAQIEQGWALVEAGDPDEAVPLLRMALPLVPASSLPAAVACRQGLAVALAENGENGDIGAGGEDGEPGRAASLLAEADLLTAQVADPRTRVRLRWLGGQAARRCGYRRAAFRSLCRAVVGLLTLGDDHDAARALLELSAFSA